MKGTQKKSADKQVSTLLLKEGGKALGPGVVKRPRREQSEENGSEQVPSYTPSEQVFRRRT
jgi:hypothetical protein